MDATDVTIGPITYALTLHRPWLWSILDGTKAIENRTWAPPTSVIGTFIALHAGLGWDKERVRIIKKLHPEMPPRDEDHVASAIVGVARVTGIARSLDEVPLAQRSWWLGPIAWLLANRIKFAKPIICRGYQRLWRLHNLSARVTAAARAARKAAT